MSQPRPALHQKGRRDGAGGGAREARPTSEGIGVAAGPDPLLPGVRKMGLDMEV